MYCYRLHNKKLAQGQELGQNQSKKTKEVKGTGLKFS
jgi:hypothetical protein